MDVLVIARAKPAPCIRDTEDGGSAAPASALVTAGEPIGVCIVVAPELDCGDEPSAAFAGVEPSDAPWRLSSTSAKGDVVSAVASPPRLATAATGAAAFSTVEATDEICIGGDQWTRKAAQRRLIPSNSRANVVNPLKPLILLC